MNEITIEAGWGIVISIILLLFIILGLRRIYIYYHPPETLGNLCYHCEFSLRRRLSIIFLAIVILASLYKNFHLYKSESVLFVIIALIVLFQSFLKDRIFENGISYNHIYIHANEIKEIIYKETRDEYWINTTFTPPFRIYIKLDKGKRWPENLFHLFRSERDV